MRKMKKCPFCGAEVKAEYPYLCFIEADGLWSLFHHCDLDVPEPTVCLHVYGNTEDEVIKRWNRGAGDE